MWISKLWRRAWQCPFGLPWRQQATIYLARLELLVLLWLASAVLMAVAGVAWLVGLVCE